MGLRCMMGKTQRINKKFEKICTWTQGLLPGNQLAIGKTVAFSVSERSEAGELECVESHLTQ